MLFHKKLFSERLSGNKFCNLILLFSLSAVLGGSVAHAGNIYSWKDSKGVVHYGDQPTYSDEKKVSVDTNSHDDGYAKQRAQQRQQLLKTYSQQQKEAETKKKENSSESSRKTVRCERAKKLQVTYQKATQLYKQDKSGKKVMLDGASKQAAEKEVNAYIAKWCA